MRRWPWLDILWLATLGIAWYRLQGQIPYALDLSASDEAYYLDLGRRWLTGVPDTDPAWSPWYVRWYGLLLRALSDPVRVHDVNIGMQALGLVGLTYGLWRRARVRPTPAGVVSLFLLSTWMLWRVEPRVMHFAWLGVLAMAFWMYPWPATVRAWSWAMASIVLMWARPEFGLLVPLFVLWGLQQRRRGMQSPWPLSARVGLGILALVAVWGLVHWGMPWQSGRGLHALVQHYRRNASRCPELGVSPQDSDARVRERLFGDATRLFEAVLANPTALARQVACNARFLPRDALRALVLHAAWWSGGTPRQAGLVLLASLPILIGGGVLWRWRYEGWRPRFSLHRLDILLWALPPLYDLLLISSERNHYLMALGWWFWWMVGTALLPRRGVRCPGCALALAGLGLALLPPLERLSAPGQPILARRELVNTLYRAGLRHVEHPVTTLVAGHPSEWLERFLGSQYIRETDWRQAYPPPQPWTWDVIVLRDRVWLTWQRAIITLPDNYCLRPLTTQVILFARTGPLSPACRQ
ncbi:MAG: hypothetical protein GXO54_07720 [Chloroflexi bacterium]|nr:hypothetical protein [Chloroflexota bacterium]